MCDKIEEKMSLFTKLILICGIVLIIINIIVFGKDLLKPNVDSTDLAIFIMFMLMGLPAMIVWGVVFLKSATELTIESDILIIKQMFRNPIDIKLNRIGQIYTFGDVKRGRHFYLIKSEVKNFNTSLISFGIGKGTLDAFMEELQLRVDKAKQGK